MEGAIFPFLLILNRQVLLPVSGSVRRQVTLPRGFNQLGNLPETEGGRVSPSLRHVVASKLSTLGGLVQVPGELVM